MPKLTIPIAPISLSCLVIAWQLICISMEVPEYILPSPARIYQAVIDVGFERWLTHLWSTLRICLLGFGLAIVVSLPLAAMMTSFKVFRAALYPILIVIQSTPIVAVAPLIIVILGTEDLPRVTIAFLITFFPIVVSTTTGMMNTPEEFIEFSKSTGAKRIRELTQIRLPYSTPYIFSGLRVAITLAIVGTVVAEFVAAEDGLGYFIQFSTSFFEIPNAFAGLFILLLLSLILFYSVAVVQRLFFNWSLPEKS